MEDIIQTDRMGSKVAENYNWSYPVLPFWGWLVPLDWTCRRVKKDT